MATLATLYLALFIAITWPLLLTPASAIVANHGDAFHDMQLFWYMRRGELLAPKVKSLFFPWGVALGAQKGFWLVPAMSVPLQMVMPLPLAYNVLCCAFFVATGVAAAVLARATHATMEGAFLAGIMLLLSPSYLAEMTGGIPENMALQWLLLYLVCGLSLRRGFNPWLALAAAVFLSLTWLTSWYLGAFAVVLSLPLPWRRVLPVLVVVAVLLSVPILSAMRHGASDGETYDPRIAADLLNGTRSIPQSPDAQRQMDKNVAPTMRVLRESVDGGRIFARYRESKMRDVLPGLLVLGLAALGLARAPRQMWPWAATAALLFGLSLGPHLLINSRDYGSLPTEWFFVHLGAYARMRPIRWVLAAMVPLAVLSAHSIPRLRQPRLAICVVGLLTGLQLFEVFVVQVAHYRVYLASARTPAYYHRLATTPLDEALIDLPLVPYSLQVGQQLYYQTVHEHMMMNYDFVSITSERALEEKAQENSVVRLITGGDPPLRRSDAEVLARAGLRTLLLHTENTPPHLAPYETFTFAGRLFDRLTQLYGTAVDEGDGILRFDMAHIAGPEAWNSFGYLREDGVKYRRICDYFEPRGDDVPGSRWRVGEVGEAIDHSGAVFLRLWMIGDAAVEVSQGGRLVGRTIHHGAAWNWLRVPLEGLQEGPIEVDLALPVPPVAGVQLTRVELMTRPSRGPLEPRPGGEDGPAAGSTPSSTTTTEPPQSP